MNKRGSAFGAFNGVYGVAWFAGSAVMGLLYDHSLIGVGRIRHRGAAGRGGDVRVAEKASG